MISKKFFFDTEIDVKAIVKKIALLFPSVRKVRDDLHNRRVRAEEFKAANDILEKRHAELLSQIDLMSDQIGKALSLKDTAVQAEAKVKSTAEHYQSQLNIMTTKCEILKEKFQALEVENCGLRLSIEDLTRVNIALTEAV